MYEEYRLSTTPPDRRAELFAFSDNAFAQVSVSRGGTDEFRDQGVLGGPGPRVLARFVTDDRCLHVERLDRREGRWVHDSTVAGFLTGHDDWAERVSRERTEQVVSSWDLSPSILDAPLVEPAST